MDQLDILIVEDDEEISNLLAFSFAYAGFKCRSASSVQDAKNQLDLLLPDFVVLDWMLPDGSGIQLLKDIRKQDRTKGLPCIMLTAKTMESDKLLGLEVGADDYLSKPFSPKELIARITSVLRRSAPHLIRKSIDFKNCTLNDDQRLTRDTLVEQIGNTEFKLLKFFFTHQDKTYSRIQLLDFIWGDHVFIEERTVDVHILRLRKILAKFDLDLHLETVRGVGYRFNSNHLEQ